MQDRLEAQWAKVLPPGEVLVAGAVVHERGTRPTESPTTAVAGILLSALAIPLLLATDKSVQSRLGFAAFIIVSAAVGLGIGNLLYRRIRARARSREGGEGSLAQRFPRSSAGTGWLLLTDRRITLWWDVRLVWELPLSHFAGVSKDSRYWLVEAGLRLHFVDGSSIRLVAKNSNRLRRMAAIRQPA